MALIGAHTLGRALEANSGYTGPWTALSQLGSGDTTTFNNEFFTLMIDSSVSYKKSVYISSHNVLPAQ